VTEEKRRSSQLIATWAQVVAMAVGIGTIMMSLGRKDQKIETTTEQVKELSSIVSDLAKAQIGLTMKDQQTDDRLRELAVRLERLERNK
jgi:outer membrane murein-binding lipoprotein Lpp